MNGQEAQTPRSVVEQWVVSLLFCAVVMWGNFLQANTPVYPEFFVVDTPNIHDQHSIDDGRSPSEVTLTCSGTGPCGVVQDGVGSCSSDSAVVGKTSAPVFLYRGSAVEAVTDLSLPGIAFPWSHTRTYDSRLISSTSAPLPSISGERWIGGLAELHIEEDAASGDITLIVNASTKRVFDEDSGSYTAPLDYTATLEIANAGTSTEEFTLTHVDTGEVFVFYGFTPEPSGIDADLHGKLKRRSNRHFEEESKNGNEYVYDEDNGQVETINIKNGAAVLYTVTYSYSSDRISSIVLKEGATELKKVEYTYFNAASHHEDVGAAGDLVQVSQSEKASDGSTWITHITQYRYYSDGDDDGGAHQLKAVYEPGAIERLVGHIPEITSASGILGEADNYSGTGSSAVEAFSSRNFTYYTSAFDTGTAQTPTPWGVQNLESDYGGSNLFESGWVRTETVNGSCSSCGGGSGGGQKRTYFYMSLSQTQPSVSEVTRIVVEDTEDASGGEAYRRIYGLNKQGKVLRRAFVEDPTATTLTVWCDSVKINSSSRVTELRKPSAHEVTSNSLLTKFLDPEGGSPTAGQNDTDTLKPSDGAIYVYDHNADGRRRWTQIKKGRTGTAYYVSGTKWGDGIVADEPKHLPVATYRFPKKTTNSGDTSRVDTSFAYDFWDTDDTQIKVKTTTLPVISTSQNGSGTATELKEYHDELGRLRWVKDGEGNITYHSYHPELGRRAYTMVDVETDSLRSDITAGVSGKYVEWDDGAGGDTIPSGFTNTDNDNLEIVTKTEYDELGRTELQIDAKSFEHYTVYQDGRTLEFPYWDRSGGEPKRAIRVVETDDAGNPVDFFTMSPSQATSTGGGSNKVPTGVSDADNQVYYLSWTHFGYDPDSGELVEEDRYFDIPREVDRELGTLSTDFHRKAFKYDGLGRREFVIEVSSGTLTSSGVEQITENVYDVRGRITRIKRGISDDSHNMGASYSIPTSGIDTVEEIVYDDGGVGDGYVTTRRRYHTTTGFTGERSHISYRGDLRGIEPFYGSGATETAIGPFTVYDMNWAGDWTAIGVYDVEPSWEGVGSTVLAGDGYNDFANTQESNRKALTKRAYDDLGRVYETEVWTINASTGQKGVKSAIEQFYDRNDNIVAQTTKNEAFVEQAYDGAGRRYQSRVVVDDIAANPYSSGAFVYRDPKPDPEVRDMDALTSSGGDDDVLQISHQELDASGQTVEIHVFEANHDDTDGIDLTDDDDYVRLSDFFWYDANTDFLTTRANYGSGDTAAGAGTWDRFAIPSPATAPTSSSDQTLVTKFLFTDSSDLETVTRPSGASGESVEKIFYDDLGRKTYVAENFVDFVVSSESGTGGTDKSEDRVTYISYNGLDQITEQAALDANGDGSTSDEQITTYLYEDSHSAALVTSIIYPDSADTDSTGSDQVKFEWNLDGSLERKTDQLETVIERTYNNRRQLDFEKVTTLAEDVDGHVRSIKIEYDSVARLEKVTSYANSDGTGTIRNQILFEYNDLGQVEKSWQSHEGAKISTTPKVEYDYDLSSLNGVYNDGARLNYVQYPDGRKIHYGYSTSGSASDRMNRVASISEDNGSGSPAATPLVSYDFSGLNRLAETHLEAPGVRLTHHHGDTDGDYEGLDRFARPKDHFWDGSPDVDRFKYTYDRAHNVTQRIVDSSIYSTQDKDQVFEYDGLERLTSYERRVLVIGPVNHEQDYTLDQLGNWTDFVEKTSGTTDLDQDRGHNDANEITSVSAPPMQPQWITPLFDAAGNMTEGPKPGDETTKHLYVYDAWNRLVKVKNAAGTTTLATYEYDGLDRRIRVEDSSQDNWDYYYNEDWQVIEIREDADPDPLKQYVWHPYYIDALAVRFWDQHTTGSQTTHFYTHDANMNVTALLDDNGSVKERYEYTPYGQVNVLNSTFGAGGGSLYDQEVLYTGQRREPISKLHHYRNREYDSSLGRFLTRDPLDYVDGLNLYEYVKSGPIIGRDPSGLLVPQAFCVGCFAALADLAKVWIDACIGNAAHPDFMKCFLYGDGTPGSGYLASIDTWGIFAVCLCCGGSAVFRKFGENAAKKAWEKWLKKKAKKKLLARQKARQLAKKKFQDEVSEKSKKRIIEWMKDIDRGSVDVNELPDGVTIDDAKRWLDLLEKSLGERSGFQTIDKRLPAIREAIRRAKP